VVIYVPYFSCSITYKTIDHISAFSYYTFESSKEFNVLEKKLSFFRKSFGYGNKYIDVLTKLLNPLLSFFPNALPLIYERFFCWIYPVEELKVVLEVRK